VATKKAAAQSMHLLVWDYDADENSSVERLFQIGIESFLYLVCAARALVPNV